MDFEDRLLTKVVVGFIMLGIGIMFKKAVNKATEQSAKVDKAESDSDVDPTIYPKLRKEALTISSSDLKLELSPLEKVVFGVIVEWHTEQRIATIVALKTGDASAYLQAGRIYMGGFAYEEIRRYVDLMINLGQRAVEETELTFTFDIPGEEKVKYWLLTNKGRHCFEIKYTALAKRQDKWHEIFHNANCILTSFRMNIQDEEEEDEIKHVFGENTV